MRLLPTLLLLLLYTLPTACQRPAAPHAFPFELVNNKLVATWWLTDALPCRTFLESGFPRQVFDVKMVERLEEEGVSFTRREASRSGIETWGNNRTLDILYEVTGQLLVKGHPLEINALVANFSKRPDWRNYDLIFPIAELGDLISIDYPNQRLSVLDAATFDTTAYTRLPATPAQHVRGLYLTDTATLVAQDGTVHTITGNFLLDLGGGNALYLNRNLPAIDSLMRNEKGLLLDYKAYNVKRSKGMDIFFPQRLTVGPLTSADNVIVVMPMRNRKSTDRYVGMLGNPFFAGYEVVYDFVGAGIYCRTVGN